LAGRSLDGTFFKDEAFRPIKVQRLVNKSEDAVLDCNGSIVLIGGRWHDLAGYGPPVDSHLSPAGEISGVTFHASYIESLLGRHFQLEVRLWVAIVVDLIVGLIIYWIFGELKPRDRFSVLLAALIPPLVAYIALVNGNVYLDFLFPMELYFVHLFYEMAKDYAENKLSPVHKSADQAEAKGAQHGG
jgi:CHASE2 domain-containing sensor protein